MINDSLWYVLENYANVDADPHELATFLSREHPPQWLDSFQGDLASAIRDGSLDSKAVRKITYRGFQDRAALNLWLRQVWSVWFPGEPYPS